MSLLTRLQTFLESIPDRRGSAFVGSSLLAFAGAWLVLQAISFAILAVYPGPATSTDLFESRNGILTGVFLAPLLETLAMRGLFWLLRRLRRGKAGLLGWSTLFWWISHLPSENWGIPAAGAFWVMSVLYLAFERRSKDQAMVYVAVFHMGFNALAYLLYHLVNG